MRLDGTLGHNLHLVMNSAAISHTSANFEQYVFEILQNLLELNIHCKILGEVWNKLDNLTETRYLLEISFTVNFHGEFAWFPAPNQYYSFLYKITRDDIT